VFGSTADGGWRSEGRISGGEGSLVFGAATAIAGEAVLVGAPFAGQGTGAVVAFGRSPEGAWTETGRITADAPGTGFGIALQPAGTDLFVGTPLAGGSGGFRVFRQGADGSWSAVQTVGLSAPFGFGGSAIAAEPEVAVIGVPGADFFQGNGLVFTRGADGQWAAGDTLFTERAGLDPITGRERPCDQGDTGPFECDANGFQIITGNVTVGNSSLDVNVDGIGATASAVPADAHYTGVNVGGNLTGQTGTTEGSYTAGVVALVDPASNALVDFSGCTPVSFISAKPCTLFCATEPKSKASMGAMGAAAIAESRTVRRLKGVRLAKGKRTNISPKVRRIGIVTR